MFAITIYDIAKLAGVSPSTVSRALNGKPGVSRKNREMIRKVLEENHYVPDETARSLVLQRTHTIGILTDDLGSQHQNEALARCQNELVVNGYQCISRYVGNEPGAMEKAISELSIRRVAGALLIGLSFTDHVRLRQAIMKWLPNTPVVLVYQNERIDSNHIYCVGANEKKGFHYCVQRMAERGRKNLVLIVEQNRASQTKIQEHFENAVRDYELASCFTYAGVNIGSGADAIAERIVEERPETDGILCVQDRLAIEVMYALQKRGKRIPEDISIIGEDNSALCEVCRPQLTSLDTMVDVCAMMSVRMLVDVLQGRSQTHKITLDMELIERETL